MKNHKIKKERIIRSLTMAALVMTLTGVGVRISKDYMNAVVHSQEEIRREVAEEGTTPSGSITDTPTVTATPTTTPTVTATVTVTVTPTPTVAPGTSVNVDVNYLSETIKVTKGPKESTRFYFSQDKQRTWQVVDDSAGGVMDLAIFMKTSDNIIYFKGDKDDSPVEIKIPKEEKKLKVTYYIESNVGRLMFENVVAGESLQYRKGKDANWVTYTTPLDLRDYEINGFTLQFRIMASATQRAGKIVNVKIPKRQNLPSVKVDYDKFVITGLKNDSTKYHVVGASGDFILFHPTDSKVKTLSLAELLLPKDTAQNYAPIPAGRIEFQTAATNKKAASGILVIDTAAQPLEPDKSKITLVGTDLTFTDASKDKVYEYLLAHEGDKIDLATAKWKKVSNSKKITIKKIGTATPVPKDLIYYRLASVKDKKTKAVTPASMYGKIAITAISN